MNPLENLSFPFSRKLRILFLTQHQIRLGFICFTHKD